jgi:hypothetical protein
MSNPRKPLNPAAQAVWDAFDNTVGDGIRDSAEREGIAAALRAALDQTIPERLDPPNRSIIELVNDAAFIGAWHIWNCEKRMRRELLAIAAELEGLT